MTFLTRFVWLCPESAGKAVSRSAPPIFRASRRGMRLRPSASLEFFDCLADSVDMNACVNKELYCDSSRFRLHATQSSNQFRWIMMPRHSNGSRKIWTDPLSVVSTFRRLLRRLGRDLYSNGLNLIKAAGATVSDTGP